MRAKILVSLSLSAAVAMTLCLATATARQAATSGSANTASSASADASTAGAPQESLADAARKAKARKAQGATKPAKVFTNDDLPSSGGISTVGVAPVDSSDASASAAAPTSEAKGEKYWRNKFATLHKKLDQDQSELDIMQRELGVLNLHNYSDPVQAMQQGYSQSDIQKKTDDIEAKKKEIADDQQAITDAEDDMRKAGGDAGWSR
jgi:hypothetical protein